MILWSFPVSRSLKLQFPCPLTRLFLEYVRGSIQCLFFSLTYCWVIESSQHQDNVFPPWENIMLPGKGDQEKKDSCRCLLEMPFCICLRPSKSIFLAEQNIQNTKWTRCWVVLSPCSWWGPGGCSRPGWWHMNADRHRQLCETCLLTHFAPLPKKIR